MLTENKFNKYLIYAIGEIILVVVGILIALSINNWNEENKKKSQLTEIYKIIKTDLVRDTTRLASEEKSYKDRIQRIQDRLEKKVSKTYFDTINASNIEECQYCNHQANNYNHVFIRKNGIELLKQFQIETSDTLSIQLLNFYRITAEFIEDDNNILRDLGRENGKLLEKYDWYPYFREKKYHPDYINYISKSQEYINKLSNYKYFAELMVRDIQYFNREAEYFIEALNNRLIIE